MYDAAIVGGGMAGMATAARLQARGFCTVVLESHSLPGGCAGCGARGTHAAPAADPAAAGGSPGAQRPCGRFSRPPISRPEMQKPPPFGRGFLA